MLFFLGPLIETKGLGCPGHRGLLWYWARRWGPSSWTGQSPWCLLPGSGSRPSPDQPPPNLRRERRPRRSAAVGFPIPLMLSLRPLEASRCPKRSAHSSRRGNPTVLSGGSNEQEDLRSRVFPGGLGPLSPGLDSTPESRGTHRIVRDSGRGRRKGSGDLPCQPALQTEGGQEAGCRDGDLRIRSSGTLMCDMKTVSFSDASSS
jgi:hypothetical protein